jgi:ABC-2 type transport system ATP-binding protein
LSVLGFDPVVQADKLRSRIGSQLQDSALPDRLRVAEAVYLFGGRDTDGLVEQFGLAQRRRSAFASLSGGERQRLFLVLALLNRPRLVILDELTQGLDPAAQRSVWAAVDQLRRDGTTVLLVTHELDEAEALCDRVIAMRAGRILDAGAPEDLIDRHGRWATIRFTVPAVRRADFSLETLGAATGVRTVEMVGDRVTIHGDRTAIAYVGAALAASGWVPPDLWADVPSLEDALLGLLDRAEIDDHSELTTSSHHTDLTGATR